MMRSYRGGHNYMRTCPNPEKNANQGCQQAPQGGMQHNVPQRARQYPVPPIEPAPPIMPDYPVHPIEPAPPIMPDYPVHPIEPAPPIMPDYPVPPIEPAPPIEPDYPVPPIAPEPPNNFPTPPYPPQKPCPCPPQKPCPSPPPRPCPPEPTCCEQMKYTPIKDKKLAPACQNSTDYITNSMGAPVDSDNNSQTVGSNGTVILKDTYLLEKLAHFNRERIPERVVHANGTAAFGSFKTTSSMSQYTCADIFSKADKITPALVRFSTVAGSKGSADTARDPRGFAVKLYTDEGNLDIVGNNLPVFFIRDSIKFPDLIHSLKPAPDTGVADPVRFWDFFSQNPEATHMVTWVYSDRGTVKSFRKMEGFGVSTFCWVNAKGERFLIKYHFVPKSGIETIDRFEAEKLAGSEPNIAKQDLFETLDCGNTVEFELYVQILPICGAGKLSFDPLDDTKIWPQAQFEHKKVGVLTLNRNFENQFTQVEQAAFCPGNVVPGIEFSDDKMLVGRVFAYTDAQRYRIGANFAELPINSPRADVRNFEQDGSMRVGFRRGTVNYAPSSCTLGKNLPVQKTNKPPFTAQYSSGNQIFSEIEKQENFTQAGERFRAMTPVEQSHLVDNIACELCFANDCITEKSLEYFAQACPKWAEMQKTRIAQYRASMTD